ncbi:MAG: EamA family transporter [Streptosporangiales bacterium]|nr:EamA family transporter [Streptosporangiales bacterium]
MLALVAATFLESRSRRPVAPRVALTVHCCTSAVIFTVLALAAGAAAPPADPMAWAAIGWIVVLSTFGGYGLYWLVLRRSGVVGVNTLMFLIAPVTAVWGALMYGEPFGLPTAAGLAIALTAVLIVGHGADRGERAPAADGLPACPDLTPAEPVGSPRTTVPAPCGRP